MALVEASRMAVARSDIAALECHRYMRCLKIGQSNLRCMLLNVLEDMPQMMVSAFVDDFRAQIH